MTNQTPHLDTAHSFQIEGQTVRGRVASLVGEGLNAILSRHAYPPVVSRLLGEAILLAALAAQSLKFEGRVLVQAEGDGPLSTLVAEVSSSGGVRGYTKINPAHEADLDAQDFSSIQDMFGTHGRLALIILQDNPDFQPYQGIVSMAHASLAQCAEAYFAQSEQIPTLIKLSVAELSQAGAPPQWIGRGLMVQQIAGDAARGETHDDWNTAQAVVGTLGDGELTDPNISVETVLFRLFHESGVRVAHGQTLIDACNCSKDRLVKTLHNMGETALEDVFEADAFVTIDCQFCARAYDIYKTDITSPN